MNTPPAGATPPAEATPPGPDETLIWRGHPSQWTNLGAYLLSLILAAGVIAGYVAFKGHPAAWPELPRELVLAALVIPALIAFVRWLGTRSHLYEVTTQRIKITDGLLSRRTNELELYRVRDYALIEPFWLRLVGRGNVVLVTADRTTGDVVLRAVPQAGHLKDQIRAHTEQMRVRRGVRDLEIDPQ